MTENWRPAIGYEGRYEVSDQGQVRSLDRRQETTRGARNVRGRLLRPSLDGCGYPAVSLRIDGKRRSVRVHRLIALAFLPPPAPFQRQVAHLDGTRTNNRASNLKWACNAENSAHKRWHGTHQAGEKSPRVKLSLEQVAEVRRSRERNTTLARRLGVNESAIRKIRNGQRWCEASQSGGEAASPNPFLPPQSQNP